jgi:hypothetical protein
MHLWSTLEAMCSVVKNLKLVHCLTAWDRVDECTNAELAPLTSLFPSTPTLECFAKHLSTELAFFKEFAKTFSLATHHVTRSNVYACKSIASGTR